MKMNAAYSRTFVFVLAIIASGCFNNLAQAQYHPDHPKVQAMVNQALGFLEKSPPSPTYQVGAACLLAYTVFKVTGDPEHPRVKQGVAVAQDIIQKAIRGSREAHIVYDTSVACLLLAAVNPDGYRPLLEGARDWFVQVQKPNGGFGYLDRPSGDTSQVQYAMLGTWALSQVGITFPTSNLEACIRYLRATQDPSGSWGYQGIVAQGQLVKQETVTKSLGTAGICGLMLACDQLKLFGTRGKDDDGIPKAFERVDNLVKAKNDAKPTIKRDQVEDGIKLAIAYQNNSPPQGAEWYYYWRYGQERYESLKELYDGKQQKSPAWYNQAVEEFARTQKPDGSWAGQITGMPDIDTSFAVLFLIRSTQKAIGKLDEGTSFGMFELPKDLTSIRMVGDRVVSNKENSVESLLSLMEDEKNYVGEGMLANNMVLSKNPKERADQIARLSRLLAGINPVARRLAARLLGRSEDLSVVPDLIYALTDKDPYVPKLAEESLRLLSRQLDVVHIRNAEPTDQQRAAAIKHWKDWYLGLKPDYIFLDR